MRLPHRQSQQLLPRKPARKGKKRRDARRRRREGDLNQRPRKTTRRGGAQARLRQRAWGSRERESSDGRRSTRRAHQADLPSPASEWQAEEINAEMLTDSGADPGAEPPFDRSERRVEGSSLAEATPKFVGWVERLGEGGGAASPLTHAAELVG